MIHVVEVDYSESGRDPLAQPETRWCHGIVMGLVRTGEAEAITPQRHVYGDVLRLGVFEFAARAGLPHALRGTPTVLREGRRLLRRAAVSASIGTALRPLIAESPFAAAVEPRDAAREYIRKRGWQPDLL